MQAVDANIYKSSRRHIWESSVLIKNNHVTYRQHCAHIPTKMKQQEILTLEAWP